MVEQPDPSVDEFIQAMLEGRSFIASRPVMEEIAKLAQLGATVPKTRLDLLIAIACVETLFGVGIQTESEEAQKNARAHFEKVRTAALRSGPSCDS